MEDVMKRRKYSFLIVLLILLISIGILPQINAAVENSYTHTKSSTYVPFAYQTYGSRLHYHYFNGNTPVYCLQWDYGTYANVSYNLYTNTTTISESERYIVGKAIQLINADSSLTDDQKYTYATQVANCVFDVTGSRCSSSWKEYETYITKAKEEVAKMELCSGTNTKGCFNNEDFNLKLDEQNYTLKKIGSSNNFISNKITLTGLLDSYGGTGTSYNVSVENCPSGSTCSICEDAWGNNCATSKTLTNPTGNYSFYVKVANGTANASLKVRATGSNSATYPYAYVYYYSSNTQMLTMLDEISVSRGVNKALTLYVPSPLTVSATKVDENGEDLTGASFEIYRATDEKGQNKVGNSLAVSNGNAIATFTEVSDTDNWTNYYYCFVETKAPIGYILKDGDKAPFCIKPSVNVDASKCYTNDENHTETDIKYCDNYQYYCSSDSEERDGAICRSEQNPTTNIPTTCPEGYEYNEDDKLCYKNSTSEVTSSTESETQTSGTEISGGVEIPPRASANPTCQNGTLVNGQCYECSGNDTFDSDKKMCIHETAAKCKDGQGNDVSDTSYCENRTNYELVNISSSGNISFVRTNRKNSVSISKTDITGKNELYGAKMKICTTKPDDNLNCEVASLELSGQCSNSSKNNGTCTNKDSTTMIQLVEWISGTSPRTWRGLEANKTYYLVETVAPLGYAISQYTSFSISDDGTVTSGGTIVSTVESSKPILVKNDLNHLSISKQDIATSQELPGAKLKICIMAEDENGEFQLIMPEDSARENDCVIAPLNNGELAEWISTDKPYEITGLDAGTYALIEEKAPEDYDVSEQIVFTMNQDGTLTDKDGNPITNNKLIMLDKKIEQVPTGDITIALVIVIGLAGIGFGSYYYFKYYKKSNKKKKENEC